MVQGLEKAPNYTGARSAAVRQAWNNEVAVVSMGGSGASRHWNKTQRDELLENGRVSGYQGHHLRSVASYPAFQGNADNITFVTRKEHLRMHGGDFRNPTENKPIDRNKMLCRTNRMRVATNEVKSLSYAVFSEAAFDGVMTAALDLIVGKFTKDTLNRCAKAVITTVASDGLEYLFSRLFLAND